MKLLIVSNMAHYSQDRTIVGWGPTVQEIDALGQLFVSITHIGCLHPEPAPSSALPYQAPNIRFSPLPPAGGHTLGAKLDILRKTPRYIRTILRELPRADAVQVRCPANISMIAIILLALVRRPRYRWVKYAGNWRPNGRESWSYTLQRWWLNKGLHRGVVTVNGRWPGQPGHVYSFLNPSLTREDIERGRRAAEDKALNSPLQLLFVGRIEEAKGAGRVLQIAAGLQERGLDFHLHMLGDGPERPEFERMAKEFEIAERVSFHGWVPKTALPAFYSRGHFIIFPSDASEGWPKVLSEAMAYGVVPIASNVSSIPQILADAGAGIALPPHDVQAYVRAVLDFVNHPDHWWSASRAGLKAAERFTYSAYLQAVRDMFRDAWGIELPVERVIVP